MTPSTRLNFSIIRTPRPKLFGFFPRVKVAYELHEPIAYFSPRYKKWITAAVGVYDGASGPAEDLVSEAWFIHDQLCNTGKFDDGTPCSNWQASWILSDLLGREGRWGRRWTWLVATGVGRPISNCFSSLFGRGKGG